MVYLLRGSLLLLSLAYPCLVYLGISQGGTLTLPLLLASMALLHLFRASRGDTPSWIWVIICTLLGGWYAIEGAAFPLKLYPVAINLSMLALFGWSLFHPPTVIEKLARLQEPDLDARGVRYTRGVTLVWCLFFAVNVMISLITTGLSDGVWALYNGFIAYLLIGLLMAGEWLFRQHYRRRT